MKQLFLVSIFSITSALCAQTTNAVKESLTAEQLVVELQYEYYMIAGKLLNHTITPVIQKLSYKTAQKILNGLKSNDANERKNAAQLLAENNCSLEKLHAITAQVTGKKNPVYTSTLNVQYGKMDETEQNNLETDFGARNIRLHEEHILNPLVCALEGRINQISTTRSRTWRKVILYSTVTSLAVVTGLRYKGKISNFFQKLRSFAK